MPLRAAFTLTKIIPAPVSWTEPDKADSYVRFQTALEVDGVVEASLTFTGGAYIDVPDRHVTLELAVEDAGTGRRIRLERLDWKSLKGGHSNPRRCNGEWSGRRVPSTHLHSFDLNWVEVEARMRTGKLPCAEPIAEELQSFEAVRVFAGRYFRINNIQIVPPPSWVYKLDL